MKKPLARVLAPLCALAIAPAFADPFPPDWNDGAGPAIHFAPAAWPGEPADPLQCGHSCGEWLPYGRFQNDLTDPRTKDPSNGGTAPQNYVNVSSSCIDKTYPSIYYSLRRGAAVNGSDDVIMFRWRVEQIANTYATGPSAGSVGSSDPWSSALWTVLFDIDGDGFRDLAAHLNGSSGSPSTAVDMIAGVWGNIPTQSIDYLNDPSIKLIAHNPTGFVGPGGKLLNFRGAMSPVESWPNGAAETSWDYGTTRAKQVSKNSCNEYFIDYQIPVRMLDASPTGPNPALDGPKITRTTPISMIFCSANSLNNPFQKDCAINKAWSSDASLPAPFGDYLSFDKDDPYAQPIISSVTAAGPGTCPGNYTLTAKVQDTLALTNGVVGHSIKAVDFFWWHDANGNGDPDEAAGQWTKIAPGASLKSGTLNTWTTSWNATSLLKGAYLIGVQAIDDRTQVDDDMPVGAHDNRTFSYATGNAQGELYVDGAWVNFTLSGGGTVEDNFPLHSPLQLPTTPAPQENWFGNPDVVGTQIAVIDVAINACGIAPTLTKSVMPADGVLIAGQDVDFTLTVSNPAGNTAAVDLTELSDLLPAGFSVKPGTTAGLFGTAEPTLSGQTATWSGTASIAPGASDTLSFTATAPAVTGIYSNQAAGDSSFGALLSNTVQLSVGEARLGLRKSVDDLSLQPGQSVTYTLDYRNDSPVDATGVVITDTLPDGLNFVSATGAGVEAGGTISWTVGDLPAGSSGGSVAFTATVADPYPASAAVPLVNTATIDSAQTAPASASVSSFVAVPRPSLTVQKSASTALVAPGASVSYTIRYANSGDGAASNVAIVDTLPAGMTFVSTAESVDGGGSHGIGAGNHAGGVVTWAIASLPAGESGTLTVNVSVDDPYAGDNPARNSVSIDSDQTALVSANADVGIESGGQVCSDFHFRDQTGAVGSDGSHRLATTSPAPQASDTGGSVTVLAPGKGGGSFLEAVRFYQDPASPGDLTFAGNITSTIYIDRANGPGLNIRSQVYDYDSTTGIRVLLGQNDTAFGGNTKGELTVVTPAAGALQDGHRLLWVYSVQSDHNANTYNVQLQFDGTVTNAISGGSTFAASGASYCATAGANLVLAKAVDRAAVAAGGQLTYTLDYANVGGASANNTMLVDTLPAGTSFVSATGGGMHAGGTVTWNLGSVAADSSGSVGVTVDVADAATLGSTTTLTNSATIDSDETSPSVATAATAIDGALPETGSPQLVFDKRATPTAAQPGDTIGYTLTLLNAGTATSSAITVSDDLSGWPAWIGYATGSIGGGDARDDSDPSLLRWTVAALAPGESITLGFDATVAAGGVPAGLTTIDNVATASGDGGISTATSAIESITVSTNPQLSLTKSVLASSAPDQPAPGDTLRYTLVVGNSGSGDAENVQVVDPIPGYTAYLSTPAASVSQGSVAFDPVDNRMLFDVGTLAGGATATLEFSVQLIEPMPAGTTTLDNRATASASNAASREATATIAANAAPALVLLKSGPASLPYPAATVSSAASASTRLFVDDASRLLPGQTIRVGGSIVTIDAIAGRALTLDAAVSAAAGSAIEVAATYSLTYRNDGDADATNVVVSDPLPAGMVYAGSSPTADSHPAIGSGGTVSWTVGALPVDGSGVVQVVALPTAAGSHVNTANLTDDDYCSGGLPAGCSAGATTDVGGLIVRKSTSTALLGPDAGGHYPAARYTISVHNAQASAANGVAVTDLLPSGFGYQSTAAIDNVGGSGPLSGPSIGDAQPQWTGFTIAAGATLAITFDAAVADSVGAATYDNGVVVTSVDAAITPFDELASSDEDVTVLGAGSGIVDGYLYRDLDVSGDFDPTIDQPLSGVGMALDSDGDSFGPYRLATDADGYFRRVLDAGTVQVEVSTADLPAGVSLTSNASGDGSDPASVVVVSGGAARKNTGYVPTGTALPPLARNDSDSAAAATPVTTSVLANDDLGSEPTAVSAFTQGSNGSVSCTASACTYTPDGGFAGSDSYGYTITDSASSSSTATVTITVAAANGLPAASDDAFSVAQDSGVHPFDVLGNDSFGSDGPASAAISVVAAAAHGTATVDDGSTPLDPLDDMIDYTPAAGFSGSDTFDYRICDVDGDCDNATVQVTITAAPPAPVASLSLAKTAALADTVVANGSADAGETIGYTLLASNTGGLTLTAVAISDPMLPVLACTPAQPATLAPGASISCSGSYAVSQADVDAAAALVNSATATGTPPSGPAVTAGDTTSTPVTAATAQVTLDKTALLDDSVSDNDTADAGETIGYTLLASNTGGLTLSAVTISDPTLPALVCTPAQPATLAPGAALSCSGSYTVSPADVDAAVALVNTAMATGIPPSGPAVSDSDVATTPVTGGVAALTLDKQAVLSDDVTDNDRADTGETIDYTLTATNSGGVSLNAVSIADPRLAALACTPAQPTTLAPGATLVCTGGETVSQAQFDAGLPISNTATVSATDGGGSPVTATDTTSTPVAGADPRIALVKTAQLDDSVSDNDTADAGETIGYSLLASNTGSVTLGAVTISDPMLPVLACTPMQPATLAPGASLSCSGSYTVSPADVDAAVALVNTATVTGSPPSGPSVSDSDDAATAVTGAAAAIGLVKTAQLEDELEADGIAQVDESIVYTLVATNLGGQSLADVAIDDPMFAVLACTPAQPLTLAPGASLECSGSHVVTPADIDSGSTLSNTATASGTPPGGPAVSATDTTATPLASPAPTAPMIGVSKTLATQTGSGPFDLQFAIVVRNFGDVALDSVQVVEDLRQTFPSPAGVQLLALTATGNLQTNPAFDGIADTGLLLPSSSTLAVGAQATIMLRIRLLPNGVPGPFENVVIASGRSPLGAVVSDDSVDGMDADPDGDGDPVEGSPTPIVIPSSLPAPAMIPVGGWLGMLVLAALMLRVAGVRLRR